MLFYDTRSTNLTFVRSGDLFAVMKEADDSLLLLKDQDDKRAVNVLQTLITKGLVCETHGL